MNFRRILTRKLAMVIPVMVMVALAIALVAVPAGAINQAPAPPGFGEALNSPVPVPTMINYQGYLTDPDGDPINGTLEMTFSIYDVPTEGVPLWTETHPSVTVTDGLFNVLLGSINPISTSHLTGESYLGVTVGADPEMTPRQQMVSVAYALVADNLDGMDSGDFVAVAGDTMTGQLILPKNGLVAGTDQFVLTDGKVSIGTTDPGKYKLYVKGGKDRGIYALGSEEGVYGQHTSSGNYGRLGTSDEGVYGYNSDSGNYGQLGTSTGGVEGYSDGTGYGVYGSGGFGVYGSGGCGVVADGSSTGVVGYGVLYGVYGYNSKGNYGRLGTPDYGVVGEHDSSGNYGRLGTKDEGVYGYNGGSGNYGQLGTSNEGVYGESVSGYGVYGYGDYGVRGDGSAYGVYGDSSINGVCGVSTSGTGVLGGSSSGKGVIGRSTSDYGVWGYNNDSLNEGRLGTSDEGVYGEHDSSGNYGQLGTSNEGVYGEYSASGNYGRLGTSNEGIYGYSSSGYGVYGYSADSCGVYGRSASGDGAYFYNVDTGNRGRLGSSNFGVFGQHNGTQNYGQLGNSTAGVYGHGTTGNYDFYAAGPGENYGPFTGAHEIKLAADFMQNFRPGLIVSVTGEAQVRTDEGEISYSSTLPTVQLADTPNDKAVFGVLIKESPLPEDHWYKGGEGERFGIVNALGEGRVWVTNVNGDIETGDYITTSAVAGYGQKQDDDILHSYTLGKAIETIDWSQVTETVDFDGQTYKIYPIAIVYTSG